MNKYLKYLSLILLIGCSKSKEEKIDSYQTWSGNQINQFILAKMPTNTIKPSFYFKDESYILPTKDWVVNKLTPQFQQFLFDYNLRQYKEGRNECDKYSLYCKTVANILNAHNANKPLSGIAVADFSYISSVNSHSINIILVSDSNNNVELLYYEPQAAQLIELQQYNLVPLVVDF